MRSTRILIGLLFAGLIGLAPVALTTTGAQAAQSTESAQETLSSRVRVWGPTGTYRYGTKMKFQFRVETYSTTNCPNAGWCIPPDTANGEVQIYRRLKGQTRWTFVTRRTNESLNMLEWYATSFGNATYKFKYTGGTYNTTTFAASSRDDYVAGSRNPRAKLVDSGRYVYAKGDVNPGWARRNVIIQRANCDGCGWSNYRTVRTNGYGQFSVRVTAPRTGRHYWRVIVPADSPRYAKGIQEIGYTYSTISRQAARAAS